VKPLVRMLAERGRQTEVSIREAAAGAGELRGADGVTLSLGAPQMSRELTEADIVRHMASSDSKRFAELLRNWIK